MRYSGAQLIIKLLERQGIEIVAGIPGGANLPIYDALADSSIRHILTRHEQGAGFIAQGMARTSGKAAVCLASSGPGASNLVTAVADAKMDSVPLIAITGQVATGLIGTDAFQELDTFGVMLPVTKHNWLVRSTGELLEVIPEAFRIATSGRPGPVAIDIPKDVQQNIIEVSQWPEPGYTVHPTMIDITALDQAIEMIRKAQRPVLYIGGGIIHANCATHLSRFAELMDLPTVCSFMGLGAMRHDHPLYLGMLGMHGAAYTNRILDECDCLIAIGVRFDDRATGKVSEFCPRASIIHIDIDASELDKIKTPAIAINSDAKSSLDYLLQHSGGTQRPLWQQRIAGLKKIYTYELTGVDDMFSPHGLLLQLARMVDKDVIMVTDVGQHQMWTAQLFPLSRSRQWISSGGLGTMGFGLPAAIGAALAEPQRKIICISGDGSLMMNIQELETAVEHALNIKIIVMNNRNLGLVRQQQQLFYAGRYSGINNRHCVDFAALARAMGAAAVDLAKTVNPVAALQDMLDKPGPMLIHVPINENAMVLPMVPPGAGNIDMITGTFDE
jgi:acetolactate synthase-1/2/3 large subunit